jgi:hypothetical protein
MFSLLFYMCTGYMIGFLTRSWGVPAIVYLLYHFVWYWPVFVKSSITPIGDQDYIVFYTLAYMMHSLLGWVLAIVLDMPNVFFGPRKCKQITCEKHRTCKMPGMPNSRKYMMYRLGMAIIIVLLVAATMLPFELIPISLSWLGVILTFIAMICVHAIFWMAFTSALPPHPFKEGQAVYLHGANSCHHCSSADMTLDVVIYMAIYYLFVIPIFCIVFIVVPTFWQFWTSLILFGPYLAFYIIARYSWLRPRGKNANTGYESECDDTCKRP